MSEVYNRLEHYEIEKSLARKLMTADKETRRSLYTELYDELFTRIPQHGMLVDKNNAQVQRDIETRLSLLTPYLKTDQTFVEIGPGDCTFAFSVATKVNKIYGVDVSEIISDQKNTPDNFELVISDGSSVPTPPNSVDIVYSNQLMEHLHPDDAYQQLKNIHTTLKTGGIYFCQTPNRLNGPHDVSRGFDQVASGFHLKEYTSYELAKLFKEVGFSKIRCVIGAKRVYFTIPAWPISVLEKLLAVLPFRFANPLCSSNLFNSLLNIRIIGFK